MEPRKILLSEKDGYEELHENDIVIATPLYSCCLIVMRMESGKIFAQHCPGSDIDTLSNVFFKSGPISQAIMVTSKESADQIRQAHNLQLKEPVCGVKLHYYASEQANGATPQIKVENDGSLTLMCENSYHLVAF